MCQAREMALERTERGFGARLADAEGQRANDRGAKHVRVDRALT